LSYFQKIAVLIKGMLVRCIIYTDIQINFIDKVRKGCKYFGLHCMCYWGGSLPIYDNFCRVMLACCYAVSVCLSRSYILWKLIKISSKCFHRQVAPLL